MQDFSQPLALIQSRISLLEDWGDRQWLTLPKMACWRDQTCRYSLTYEDYCQLAETLKLRCREVYDDRNVDGNRDRSG